MWNWYHCEGPVARNPTRPILSILEHCAKRYAFLKLSEVVQDSKHCSYCSCYSSYSVKKGKIVNSTARAAIRTRASPESRGRASHLAGSPVSYIGYYFLYNLYVFKKTEKKYIIASSPTSGRQRLQTLNGLQGAAPRRPAAALV